MNDNMVKKVKKRDYLLIGMITLVTIMFGCNQNAATPAVF